MAQARIWTAEAVKNIILSANVFDWFDSDTITNAATGRFVRWGNLWYAEFSIFGPAYLVETREASAAGILPPDWINADGSPTALTTIAYLDAMGNVSDSTGGFVVKDGIVVETARTVGKGLGEIVTGVTEASGAGVAAGIAAIFKTNPVVGFVGVAVVGSVLFYVIKKWRG